MMRKYLVCLLIVLLLIALPSCKKKDGTDESAAGVVSDAEAVVTAEVEKVEAPGSVLSGKGAGVETEEEVPVEDKSEPLAFVDMTENVDEDAAIEEFYRGGKFFIRGYFDKEEGELIFEGVEDDEIISILASFVTLNPDSGNMTFNLENGTVSLGYSELSVDEREELWRAFVSFMNDYNASLESENVVIVPKSVETEKGMLSCEIYPDKIVLFIPSEMSGEELTAFASYLVTSYPELLDLFTYETSGSTVTLYYLSGADNGLASEYFDYLGREIDSYFALSRVEETPSEEVAVAGGEEDKDKTETVEPLEAKEEVIPQTKKGETVKKFSSSLSVFSGYDTATGGLSFVAKGALEYRVLPSLSLGIVSGYDFEGYIPLSAALRYHTPLDGLYFGAAAGALICVGDNKGSVGLVLGLNFGYEYEFNNGFTAFIEADGSYIRTGDDNHFRFGLTLGSRCRF